MQAVDQHRGLYGGLRWRLCVRFGQGSWDLQLGQGSGEARLVEAGAH